MAPIYNLSMAQDRPTYGRTFIREWRQYRHYTLQRLAGRVGMTAGNLSHIERGLTPYNQGTLEALAKALQTDPASLLMRNPRDPEGIWSIWEQAKPGVRQQLVEIGKTLVKTGTDPE